MTGTKTKKIDGKVYQYYGWAKTQVGVRRVMERAFVDDGYTSIRTVPIGKKYQIWVRK